MFQHKIVNTAQKRLNSSAVLSAHTKLARPSSSTGITITSTSMTSNPACIITTTTAPAMTSTYYIQLRNFIEGNVTWILH